jgi:GDP-mannose pyrophosphatase NudK
VKATIIHKKILSKLWGEYAQYELHYQRTDGTKETHIREMQDNGHGAAVLLYNIEKREVVLIRQFRLAALLYNNISEGLIEVCAGLVNDDDAAVTIKKEIAEEVGFHIDKVEFLFKGFASPGAKTEMIYFFTAAYDDKTPKTIGGGLSEEQEDIETIFMDFDDAYNMIYTQEIIDQKTITLLLYAKLTIFK